MLPLPGNLWPIWLLLTPICYQNFLMATWLLWLLFWQLLKIWQKTGFGSISLCFVVDIIAFWKSFDVDILGFQNCLDVGLLGFSKIWLLFAKTIWQHSKFTMTDLLSIKLGLFNSQQREAWEAVLQDLVDFHKVGVFRGQIVGKFLVWWKFISGGISGVFWKW